MRLLTLLFSALFAASSLAAAEPSAAQFDPAKDTLVYVGTYTGPKSKGIYLFKLQTENAEVSQNVLLLPLGLAAESSNPSFLEVDLKRRLVFAVNEDDNYDGKKSGAVSAFKMDASTGKLTLINRQSSEGAHPCHLVLDKTGRHLLVANYTGGSVAVIPVGADGKLGPASTTIKHSGKSINPERQEAPHAHCVTLDPANRFAFVSDLGIDKLVAYRFDADTGKLTAHDAGTVSLKPGAGPRHMVFRPDGKFGYVINELNSTVTAFRYDADAGKLTEIQTVSTLPPHFEGANTTAEISITPNGKYLYASNRGHNSLMLFAIDAEQGTLNDVEDQSTNGKKPRHFGIQPSGRHLAIANQDSDNLLLCRIEEGNGRLKPSGMVADCPSPVCVVFVPPAGK